MEKVLKHNLPRLNFRWGNFLEVFYAVLLPLSFLWALVAFLKRKYTKKEKTYRSTLPVLSVGNIHSGGSGKTPIVAAIAERFKDLSPAIVSRGYKASLSSKGAKVNMQGAFAVGDEPWMLHKLFGLSVWIGKDRIRNIKKIESLQVSNLVILDDGFQHIKVQRDLDLVAIDTNRSPDENFCLPLGDLREPRSALKNADAILLTGQSQSGFDTWRKSLETDFPGIKIFEAKLKVDGLYYGDSPLSEFRMKKLLAFSGIANNKRFENTLGYLPHAQYFKGYPDHHAYTQDDVGEIIAQGKELEVDGYVTTDKDWVKVSRFFRESDELVISLRVGYSFSEGFWDYLDSRMGKKC